MFTFQTAADVSLASIVHAINLVYPNDGDNVSDYAAMIATTQLDFGHSVVALDDAGHVAGIAMLGVRAERGWCGDAAVLPQYQNQGLGQDLMRRLSDTARQMGLRTLQLEVRDSNAPARRVYEKEGYAYTHRMPCYAATQGVLGAPLLPDGLTLRRLADDAAARIALQEWCDPDFAPSPCWERELPTLLSLRRPSAWLAERDDEDAAFLWATPSSDGKTLNIGLLALDDPAEDKDIRALCAHALAQSGAERIRIGLEPIDSRVAELFRAWDFTLDKDLWEMVKTL
jgi:ribosomal protein S18 acetylase RimI-like enzyme